MATAKNTTEVSEQIVKRSDKFAALKASTQQTKALNLDCFKEQEGTAAISIVGFEELTINDNTSFRLLVSNNGQQAAVNASSLKGGLSDALVASVMQAIDGGSEEVRGKAIVITFAKPVAVSVKYRRRFLVATEDMLSKMTEGAYKEAVKSDGNRIHYISYWK